MTHPRKILGAAIAALALAGPAGTASANGETSDLWWDPNESGWGMNVVQQGEVAFVTLFVYGPDQRPTWYFAPDARVFALGESSRPAFRGTLFQASGPWLGGPFDPSKVAARPVGYAILEPRADGRLRVEYQAEGVTVSKDVERQTFAAPELGFHCLGAFSLRVITGAGLPGEIVRYRADVRLEIEAGELRMGVIADAGRCDYRAPYRPAGRFASATGTVACEDGSVGTFRIADLELTRHGLSGYLREELPGAIRQGRFAAARF